LPIHGHLRLALKIPGEIPELRRDLPEPSRQLGTRPTGPQSKEEAMKTKPFSLLAAVASIGLAQSASADVIADWNEKAVAYVLGRSLGPPPAERIMAMTHVAMFDAVNSIERKYRPYLVQLPAAPTASKEAAAAAAAGTVLARINPQAQADVTTALAAYLAAIPDSPAKAEGIRLGEAVAAKILEARVNDGAATPDSYRAKTPPGVYVPTPAMWAPQWPNVKPFAMTSNAQFRPAPPIPLASAEWTADYNEIKSLGRFDSKTRSGRQTEDARFWLAVGGNVYYPVVHSVAVAKKLSLVDSARLFALVAVARADALIAVFDAKYHYDFWRPLTAIRHGDNDDNPATERDATWRPIADTPMHPEYPCAHCIAAASTCSVLEAVLGSAEIPEVAMTSPTAPGVTHRWTNLRAFVKEVSEARIWAGFHYRFSTRVGEDMGQEIGAYTVKTLMQPLTVATR
jgi:PAP2 superfamily